MLSFAKRLVLAGAMLALLAPAGAATAKGPATNPEKNPVVARVNGQDITLENVQGATSTLVPLMSYHSAISDERFRQIQKKALNTIIDDILIYEYAKKNNVKVDKKKLKEELDKVKKRVPKGQKLEEILERGGMTMDDLSNEVEYNLLVREMRSKKKEEFQKKTEDAVTDEFMRKYYENNKEKFKEPAKIHISEILIKADPGGGQKVWMAAKKKAQGLKDRVDAGEDFAKLAKEFSEDVYAEKGGDMAWAHLGSLSPELEETAKGLKKGEVGGPVMSIYGYHIVKLNGEKPAKQKSYEDLNLEKLKSELKIKEYKRLWEEWIEELRSGAKIEYLAERFMPDKK